MSNTTHDTILIHPCPRRIIYLLVRLCFLQGYYLNLLFIFVCKKIWVSFSLFYIMLLFSFSRSGWVSSLCAFLKRSVRTVAGLGNDLKKHSRPSAFSELIFISYGRLWGCCRSFKKSNS